MTCPTGFDHRVAFRICLMMRRDGEATIVPRPIGEWLERHGFAEVVHRHAWREYGVTADPVSRGVDPHPELSVRLTDDGVTAAETCASRAQGSPMSNERPSYEAAQKAAEEFLKRFGADVPFDLIEDGDDGWAFWIMDDDTTSYVHQDLKIEWYGTTWTSAHCCREYPHDDGEPG